MKALQEFEQVMSRICKAEIYMDMAYKNGLTGEALEDAIKECEKFIPTLQGLLKQASRLMKELGIDDISTDKGIIND